MINRSQLLLELAAQFYINKDRTTVGWGSSFIPEGEVPDFPDPDRQWYVYRDEWLALSDSERQVWLDKASNWLDSWSEKYPDLYSTLLEYAKPVLQDL